MDRFVIRKKVNSVIDSQSTENLRNFENEILESSLESRFDVEDSNIRSQNEFSYEKVLRVD